MKTVGDLTNINKAKGDAPKKMRPTSAIVKVEGVTKPIFSSTDFPKEKPPKGSSSINMPKIDEKNNNDKKQKNPGSRIVTQQSAKEKTQPPSEAIKKMNIEVLMNKEMRMHRILPENTMYRIAQPQPSGYEISEKYWKESNKTNSKSR